MGNFKSCDFFHDVKNNMSTFLPTVSNCLTTFIHNFPLLRKVVLSNYLCLCNFFIINLDFYKIK